MEWSERSEQAYAMALYLNNKYELDGRNPNGYAGVTWCFGKHSHPWKERFICGKIRYMHARGLRRKFDADKYVRMVNTTALTEVLTYRLSDHASWGYRPLLIIMRKVSLTFRF